MRYGLVENGACQFVLGLGLGGCMAVYPKSMIQAIADRFRKQQHIAQFQKFFTLFFSTLHQAECDKLGRVGIPATLRQAVGLKERDEIMIVGVLDKVEIWPKEVYDQNLRTMLEGKTPGMNLSKMIEEAFALLGNDASASVGSGSAGGVLGN
jgi:MraZ protein